MSTKRPRVSRREAERAAKKLVQDREKLALLSPGGARDRPMVVTSSAVIEPRVEGMPCIQCGGQYRVREHEAPASGLRRVEVTCRQCSAPRTLWFRLSPDDPN